jgi:hypothetical protein
MPKPMPVVLGIEFWRSQLSTTKSAKLHESLNPPTASLSTKVKFNHRGREDAEAGDGVLAKQYARRNLCELCNAVVKSRDEILLDPLRPHLNSGNNFVFCQGNAHDAGMGGAQGL